MYELKGVVKDYAWGGYCYIPMILSQKADGKPSAHFEHTVLVTKDGYQILTKR